MGSYEGHGGHEEESSNEGHEGYGCNEGHEGYEEEESNEGHEGRCPCTCHEGHEGHEEKESNEGHEGRRPCTCHEGHEGNEEKGSNEGHEEVGCHEGQGALSVSIHRHPKASASYQEMHTSMTVDCCRSG